LTVSALPKGYSIVSAAYRSPTTGVEEVAELIQEVL
jgi:hypothetical protein